MVRTMSNVSTMTSMTSPVIPRTPASLQPYLDSESDFPDVGDSEATPRAEKSEGQCEVKTEAPKAIRPKVEPHKILPPRSDPGLNALAEERPSEPTKITSVSSTSRTALPQPSSQEAQYKDLHQPAPKHPIPSSLAFGPEQSNSAPAYPYSNIQPGLPNFNSPHLAYLPLPPQADPSATQQALVPQGMLYYPEFVPPPPPPAPEAPHQLQYPPGSHNRLRAESPMELLNRVHYAMPDLHALLDSYHNMYGALASREAHIQTIEAQRTAEKQEQERRLTKLEKELDSLLKKHSAESSRLRLDISNVDKKCKDLQDKLTAEERANDTLEAINETLRADKKQAAKKHEDDKATMTQKHSLDRDRLTAEHSARQRASNEELQAQIRRAEASLSHKEAHLGRTHEEEKHKMEIVWTKQKREIDDRHARLQIDLERKLEAKQKVVDEERQTYLQAREGWDREREMLTRRWDEERGLLRKASEEQHKALITKHEREKNEILKQISQMQHRTDKEDSLLKLQREIETLRSGWEADKFKFQRTTAEFKSTARTLNEQNGKLQRLTEAFGDIIDVKGKQGGV